MVNKDCTSTDRNKELSPAEIMKGEHLMRVQRAVGAFSAFISPFEVEDGLVSLASGRKVQKDVADDLVSVDTTGRALFDNFVKNRPKDKTVNFHKPLEKEEADTQIIILQCISASRQPNCETIVARSPDTDVFLPLLSLSSRSFFVTFCGTVPGLSVTTLLRRDTLMDSSDVIDPASMTSSDVSDVAPTEEVRVPPKAAVKQCETSYGFVKIGQ
ncbi:hypothetical protein RRG08_000684 [Elysia crispata]|uniref:Uncharacterized protein n=1 Tax=Elysia crispata TaxID=231223 RepID=A0AAE1AV82_9GAST|nr:hypothetical protein RRG08_000684 [Elysia crispata]